MSDKLIVQDLRKSFVADGEVVTALHGVSLEVERGEFFTLLGPSGCGKTTTLRSVAGLETPDSGSISIGRQLAFADRPKRINLKPEQRDISMVFQSYAIWPHMTVRKNVEFPLAARRTPKALASTRANEALELVGLGAYADRPATQLSGGQQQRVALARAIVKEAAVLLLDEPLSNLDAQLRVQMRQEITSLQRRLGATTLYVTHDQEEALAMSDRIALMRDGRAIEIGTPDDLYHRPTTAFAARFIGQSKLWPCTVEKRLADGVVEVSSELGRTTASAVPTLGDDATGLLLVRPEHIELAPLGRSTAPSTVATIETVEFTGTNYHYGLRINSALVPCSVPSSQQYDIGASVDVTLPPAHALVLPDDGHRDPREADRQTVWIQDPDQVDPTMDVAATSDA